MEKTKNSKKFFSDSKIEKKIFNKKFKFFMNFFVKISFSFLHTKKFLLFFFIKIEMKMEDSPWKVIFQIFLLKFQLILFFKLKKFFYKFFFNIFLPLEKPLILKMKNSHIGTRERTKPIFSISLGFQESSISSFFYSHFSFIQSFFFENFGIKNF